MSQNPEWSQIHQKWRGDGEEYVPSRRVWKAGEVTRVEMTWRVERRAASSAADWASV